MREDQIDQAERRETLDNDLKVLQQQQREQGSTFFQHGQSQADETNQGRFRATGVPTVIGAAPVVQYPQAAPPFQRDPVPDEPSLGFEINRLSAHELESSINSADPEQSPQPPAAQGPTDVVPSSVATGGDARSEAPSADTVTSAGSSMFERSASPPSFSPDDGGFDDAA
jgi:hypothetical protein